MASVVIPAHNEAAVIERCLQRLGHGAAPGQLEIVVVSNGCTDSTATIARQVATGMGGDTTVLETTVGSKIVALRLGDAQATTFPRIYLDADIELTGSAALTLARRLDGSGALAGRPRLRYDTGQATFLVRRYYAARARVPTLMTALWGAGVYAMSEPGRARFEEWPDVTGDDLYVDLLFSPEETEIVDTDPAVVRTPQTTQSLLKVLRRAHRGKQAMPASDVTRSADSLGATIRGLARSCRGGLRDTFDAAVFAGFAVTARLAASTTTSRVWERDDTTRAGR